MQLCCSTASLFLVIVARAQASPANALEPSLGASALGEIKEARYACMMTVVLAHTLPQQVICIKLVVAYVFFFMANGKHVALFNKL